MKTVAFAVALALVQTMNSFAESIHQIPVKDIELQATTLGAYKGKVLLVVNVASKCGLTPQYKGLEALYQKYKEQGLVVAGFPCNQFGAQEPGTNDQIKEFCSTKYKVTFPMLSKVVVKGADQVPLYKTLVEATPDKDGKVKQVGWNFEKFLIGRDGKVAARFAPTVEPSAAELTKAIKAELEKKVK